MLPMLLSLKMTSLMMKMSTEKKFILTMMRTIGKLSISSRLHQLYLKSGESHTIQNLMRIWRSLKSLKV